MNLGLSSMLDSGSPPNNCVSVPCHFYRTSLVAQMVRSLPAMRETQGSIPDSGRSLGEGDGYPSALESQYSRLHPVH